MRTTLAHGAWQTGSVVVNFSRTDVGSGNAYTEWSTDGVSWTQGEVAEVGGEGEITVSYRDVDKVGLMSASTTSASAPSTRPATSRPGGAQPRSRCGRPAAEGEPASFV